MDEIEKRLREGTDACIKNYEEWRSNQKNGPAREALQETIHELRKIASRLEIEMAISERDNMASRPIPIPPHRSSRPNRGAENEGAEYDEDSHSDNRGNGNGNGNSNNNGEHMRRSGGGHRGGGRGGRPHRPSQAAEE